MAAVFVLLLLRYDISPELLRAMLFVSVLLAVALIDLESFTIPDRLLGAAAAVWAVFMPFAGEGPLRYVCGGLLGGFAIAGAMLAMSLIADRILKKESMGGGDIKLFFVTGLYFGLMQNFFNLILSCVIGIIMALSGMGKKENGEGSEPMGAVPFGPAIAVSAVITMLAGQRICGWYLGLF